MRYPLNTGKSSNSVTLVVIPNDTQGDYRPVRNSNESRQDRLSGAVAESGRISVTSSSFHS